MYQVMEKLKGYAGKYEIDFVPFNGEEYFGVKGQLAYLDYIKRGNEDIKLVLNIDSPGHLNSKTALSMYNFNNETQVWIDNEIEKNDYITKGAEWYAGDHSMFAFQGIPCIAVTSSNLIETVLNITHTPKDTIDNINIDILTETSEFLKNIIKAYK